MARPQDRFACPQAIRDASASATERQRRSLAGGVAAYER
jgi:hypothetical protein